MGSATLDEDDPARGKAPPVDGASFEVWYRAAYPGLVATLQSLGASPDVAADAAAEAFARALARWDRVGVMSSPTGWTYRVALNLTRRWARRARREAEELARQRPLLAGAVDPDVWEAVAALAHRQRSAVVLHYLLDLPYAEVARVMGVAEGTIAATLAAARQRLAAVLRPSTAGEDTRARRACSPSRGAGRRSGNNG